MSMVATVIAQSACCSIDDDLSDCGTDYEITYELQLVTNESTELQSKLGTEAEAPMREALRAHLSPVFSDHGDDLEQWFYSPEGGEEQHHENKVMDASERTYTIYLPERQYRHLAVANVGQAPQVSMSGTSSSSTFALSEVSAAPHARGLFAGNELLEANGSSTAHFHVPLFMVNCASALVIDKRGHEPQKVEASAKGFAKSYNMLDGTYTFAQQDAVHSVDEVQATGSDLLCYVTVNYPSREAGTRSVEETTVPFESSDSSEDLWQWDVYVTKADGSVTATKLSVRRPLRAGQLMIIKGYIDDDGAVRTGDASVGVSVTLDWNKGGDHDVDL